MRRPSESNVLLAVARVTGVSRHFLTGQSRRALFVRARAVAAIALRRFRCMSWPEVGHTLNRSHSTVIELVGTYEQDRRIRADVEKVSEILHALNDSENSAPKAAQLERNPVP